MMSVFCALYSFLPHNAVTLPGFYCFGNLRHSWHYQQ